MPTARSRSHLTVLTLFVSTMMLALAACGPLAANGGTRYAYDRNGSYPVVAGESVLVDLTIDLEDLGLDEETVNGLVSTWIPAGLNGESANGAQFVFLEDVTVDAGWEARLWQVRIVRERPFSDPSAERTYRIDATVRVDVPADAYDLTRRVSGALVARSGDVEYGVTFLVEAR